MSVLFWERSGSNYHSKYGNTCRCNLRWHVFLIWLNMLMFRCNVLGKGERDGEFVYLRPVFKSILAASILVMLIVLRQKKELINEFSLWFISVLCIGVSAITLFMSGFIVDEYNLGGDVQSFNMFIAIGCISGLNFIIYYRRK